MKAEEKKVIIPPKYDSKEDSDDDYGDVEIDFSEINPEEQWECFGSIEPDHVECKECPYRGKCAVKSGVSI